jgi:2-oxoglutarate dehydrogenase E1 component
MESIREAGGLLQAYKKDGGFSWRGGQSVRYAGRDQSAAPATGLKKLHKYEETALLSEALMSGKLMKAKEMINGLPKFI